jgi:lipoprotein-anchoring transpeptidase ErfK/SrfK
MKRLVLVLMLAGLAGLTLYHITKRGDSEGEEPGALAKSADTVSLGAGPSRAAEPAAAQARPEPPRAPAAPVLSATTRVAVEPAREAGGAAPEAAPPPVRVAEPDGTAVGAIVVKAQEALQAGDRLKAWLLFSQAYRNGSKAQRELVLGSVDRLARELFWNPRSTTGATIHEVKRGESLVRIGRKYGVNGMGIARLNGIVRAHLIKVGQKLRVFPGAQEIVVSKSDFTLTLFVGGRFVRQYKVGLGKENRTPVGSFEINNPLKEPDWYPPEGGVIKFGDKRNLLGTRWLGFKDQPGLTGFGIHGTWEPDSVGQMVSNGCVRMRNAEVEELYDFVVPGARVVIEP